MVGRVLIHLKGGGGMPPKVLVICGPTASGKTALAVALAKAQGEAARAAARARKDEDET